MSTKYKLGLFFITFLFLFSIGLCNSILAKSEIDTKFEYTINYGFGDPYEPFGNPQSAWCAVFKKKVEEFTDGRVTVKLFPNGQLGDQLSMLQQVKTGELEMAGIAGAPLASALYPPFSIFSLPYLVKDHKIAEDLLVMDNPFVKYIVSDLKEKTGVSILTIAPQGFRNLTNNVRPIKSPEDLKGLKIRTMQVTPHIKMINSAGANAVPVPWLELYSALETGVVDGQENPLALIKSMHYDEVQDYLTISKHVLLSGIRVYNVEWFESLPKDLQVAIIKAAEHARSSDFGLNNIMDALLLEEFDQSSKINVYIPTSEEINMFKEAMQPAAFNWFFEEVEEGEELIEMLNAEIDKIEERYINLIY